MVKTRIDTFDAVPEFVYTENNPAWAPHGVISIKGARTHNLKNISLDIPRHKFVVITGVSGSGKSSLAFDTIYAEGQRRYVESLSAYARQFLHMMDKPDVDAITGLSPAISIDQKTRSQNPRSTVGTVTEIYDYMRLLFARVGVPYSPATGLPIEAQSIDQMADQIATIEGGTKLLILAPVVRDRKGSFAPSSSVTSSRDSSASSSTAKFMPSMLFLRSAGTISTPWLWSSTA